MNYIDLRSNLGASRNSVDWRWHMQFFGFTVFAH